MRFPMLFLLSVLMRFDHAVSTGSGIQCPIEDPAPPIECDSSNTTWIPVSVEGSKTFCTLGPDICVADKFAACPGPSDQLPYGSKCVRLPTTGVFGCVPKTSCDDGMLDAVDPSSICEGGCTVDPSIPRACNASEGWTEVSVVNIGTFCAKGTICSGENQAQCPQPQHGLPFGSTCVRIPTGVFGCVQNTKCQTACNSTALDPAVGNSSGSNMINNGAISNPASVAPTPTVTSSSTPVVSTPSPTLQPVLSTSSPAPTPRFTTSSPSVPTASTVAPSGKSSNNVPWNPVEGDENVSLLPVPSLDEVSLLLM